jgi:hypothetical protein
VCDEEEPFAPSLSAAATIFDWGFYVVYVDICHIMVVGKESSNFWLDALFGFEKKPEKKACIRNACIEHGCRTTAIELGTRSL